MSLALAERLQREESTKKHTKRKRQADADADLAMRLQRKEDERARAKRQRQIERDSELARKMARSSYAVGPRLTYLTVCTNCGVSMDRRSPHCPSCKRKNSLPSLLRIAEKLWKCAVTARSMRSSNASSIPLRQRRAKSFLKLARRSMPPSWPSFLRGCAKGMLPVVKENRPRKQAINTELRHSVQQAKCLYSPGFARKEGYRVSKPTTQGIPPAVPSQHHHHHHHHHCHHHHLRQKAFMKPQHSSLTLRVLRNASMEEQKLARTYRGCRQQALHSCPLASGCFHRPGTALRGWRSTARRNACDSTKALRFFFSFVFNFKFKDMPREMPFPQLLMRLRRHPPIINQ